MVVLFSQILISGIAIIFKYTKFAYSFIILTSYKIIEYHFSIQFHLTNESLATDSENV